MAGHSVVFNLQLENGVLMQCSCTVIAVNRIVQGLTTELSTQSS